MEKTKLSPPWYTFVSELKALFGSDPEIKIEYGENSYIVKLFVDQQDKADALMSILPTVKNFGNVDLQIVVIPADNSSSYGSTLRTAFKGNPVVSDIVDVQTPFGDVTYTVFKKEVVQFYNDQMDDLNGNKSMLYQDIARDVFGDLSGTFFCTDNK